MKILLAEDDFSLGKTIQKWLQLDGYIVNWLTNGKEIQALSPFTDYNCLLLDRGLPHINGDQILQSARKENPFLLIIMITARDSIGDRIEGLDLGADDYLVKPFDLEELSARIRAHSRRSIQPIQSALQHDDVELLIDHKTVYKNGKMIDLTGKEYAILLTFMQHPSQTFTREQLEEKLYDWSSDIGSNAVEVHIHHLRKKLGNDFIITRRGLGYSLSAKK